jgi:hypothetical protein
MSKGHFLFETDEAGFYWGAKLGQKKLWPSRAFKNLMRGRRRFFKKYFLKRRFQV